MGAKAKKPPAAPAAQVIQLPPGTDSLLSRNQIAASLQISVGLLKKMQSAGEYPAPDAKIGPLCRWKVETHNAFIAARCVPKG